MTCSQFGCEVTRDTRVAYITEKYHSNIDSFERICIDLHIINLSNIVIHFIFAYFYKF